MARVTRADRLAFLLYIAVAVAVGFADYRVRPGNLQSYPVNEYIPGVLNGTYGAPANYRVLAPYLIDAFTRASGIDPLVAFVVTRLVFIYASLLALHAYARHWYSSAAAVAGVLGVAALLPLTFTNGWANPDSFPELLLFTIGCLLVAQARPALFAVVLAIATLNRETAGFLVLLWAAAMFGRVPARRYGLQLVSFVLIWATIYIGLRWGRGYQPYELWMLPQNLRDLQFAPAGYDPYRRVFGVFWIILLAVPAWIAIDVARQRATPVFIRRTLPVAAAFAVTCLRISKVIEARIFTPMFPLLMPAVLGAFSQASAASVQEADVA